MTFIYYQVHTSVDIFINITSVHYKSTPRYPVLTNVYKYAQTAVFHFK